MAQKPAKPTQQIWESIRFDQEKVLSDRLRQVLHADVLEPILEKCKYTGEKDHWQAIFAGQYFRLTPHLAPRLHKLCEEVKEMLYFEDPIEFFVSNNPTINAAAYLRESAEHNHIILVHSGMIERFSEEELRFVLGHELGHIIYKTAHVRRLIEDLFPTEDKVPIPLRNLICLWEKFAEISADRLGYFVSPNLECCVSNFFKLSSGLSLDKVNFSFASYLEEVDTIISKFSESSALFQGTHPTNPIRVKALQYFSESQLYKKFAKKQEAVEDAAFSEKMMSLVNLLELHPDNERDYYRLLLVASGGFFTANLDEQISQEEEEKILEYISRFTVHPRQYLASILAKSKKKKDIHDLMMAACEKLVSIDPGERYPIFSYLSEVIIADKSISPKEVQFLFDLATKTLGMHEIEASRLFIQTLHQQGFTPRV